MRIGSLFSGAGGLDLAVEAVFGGETVWHSELDPAASAVLAYRWPGVPNLGDITQVDWAAVEPVDVLCGGFPCLDVSVAGKRAGIKAGTRSGLWLHMLRAVAAGLRPRYVVVENVLGLASSGEIDLVTGGLVEAGYTVRWTVNSAASVGAPHRRRRVFIVATQSESPNVERVAGDAGGPGYKLFPTPEAKNSHAGQDYARAGRPNSGGDDLVTAVIKGCSTDFAEYETAIGRWERETGRACPSPVEFSSGDGLRLNPAFSEWIMGWPAGWVTGVPGYQDALFGKPALAFGRNDQLKLCGNGVVPQQARAALRYLLSVAEVAA